MTNAESVAIQFIAGSEFAKKFDPASAMFDFPRAKVAHFVKFLGLEMSDVKDVAANVKAGADVCEWTAEFTAGIIPLCILF